MGSIQGAVLPRKRKRTNIIRRAGSLIPRQHRFYFPWKILARGGAWSHNSVTFYLWTQANPWTSAIQSMKWDPKKSSLPIVRKFKRDNAEGSPTGKLERRRHKSIVTENLQSAQRPTTAGDMSPLNTRGSGNSNLSWGARETLLNEETSQEVSTFWTTGHHLTEPSSNLRDPTVYISSWLQLTKHQRDFGAKTCYFIIVWILGGSHDSFFSPFISH